MRLRRSFLALVAATVTAGAVVAAAPALAAPTSAHPANAHVTVAFALDADADAAVWALKPTSSFHKPVQFGNVSRGITIAPLKPGTYVLQIQEVLKEDLGGAYGDYASKKFTVKSGQTLDLYTLKATHQPLTLSGTGPRGGVVSDDFDDSIAFGSSSKVDASGHYALHGLIPGTYKITVQKKGYADKNYTVVVREPVQNVTVGRKLQ